MVCCCACSKARGAQLFTSTLFPHASMIADQFSKPSGTTGGALRLRYFVAAGRGPCVNTISATKQSNNRVPCLDRRRTGTTLLYAVPRLTVGLLLKASCTISGYEPERLTRH